MPKWLTILHPVQKAFWEFSIKNLTVWVAMVGGLNYMHRFCFHYHHLRQLEILFSFVYIPLELVSGQ